MPEDIPDPPSRARMIVAGLVVAAFAAAICWFVEWRSAPPPPPPLHMPGSAPLAETHPPGH